MEDFSLQAANGAVLPHADIGPKYRDPEQLVPARVPHSRTGPRERTQLRCQETPLGP